MMDISSMESRNIGDYFDEHMTFLKQIGVGYLECHCTFKVDPNLPSITMGNKEDTAKSIHKIKESGLNVRVLAFNFVHSLMGRPEGEKEIERGCEIIKLMGEEEISIMRIFPQGIRLGPSGVPGRYQRAHRGGAINAAFRLDYMREELAKRDLESQWAHHYKEKITYDEYFSNWVKLLERIVPIAEDSGVTIVEHFDDPPVPNYWNEGLLPANHDPLMIKRLFEAVPSKNFGLLFCVGTRYESGRDVYEQIRLFGRKIYHVHLRNVRGTILHSGGYDEVFIDDGDMDMFKVLKTLKDVGYDGYISPDHPPILIDDEKRRAGLAFMVGYIRAIIQTL
jgi:mannonate dehydratase